MLRTIACMMAGMLVLLPASAQTLERSVSSAQTVQLSATSFPAQPAVAMERIDIADQATRRSAVQSQAGALAAAVFRVLASQNTIALNGLPPAETDAVLHHPAIGPSDGSLFSGAKKLYDRATSYKSERAVITVDPLSLRCRLKVSLGR